MRALTSLFLSLCFAAAAWTQQADPSFDPMKSVTLRMDKGAVVLWTPPGSHLKTAFMAVEKKEGPGILAMGKLPPPTGKDELGDGIWHGAVRVPVTGQGLQGEVILQVTYQPCTEGDGGVCFAPATRLLYVKASDIPQAEAGEKPQPAPAAALQASAPSESVPAAVPPPQPDPGPPAESAPSRKGLLLSLLIVFLFGMGASFTPCVYPMIPITMAIVGAKGSGKARGFALSLMLVLGMAVTYTALGVIAAKTGAVAGEFAQRPVFLVPVALLFTAFALSLFGAFEIALPPSLAAKLQGSGSRKGFGGAFLMGLVLGPLSAPCVGPVIGTVLVDIARKGAEPGAVWMGGLQLFIFALGMGVLFLAVGTFSAALPKSGDWLTRFKQVMGLVVLGFAAWSVRLIVPEWANFAMWSVVALTSAAVFGAFEAVEGLLGQLDKGFAILLLALGVLLGVRAVETGFRIDLLPKGGTAAEAGPAHEGWMEQDLEGALAKAKAEGKLVLVDVYADWCAQCKELDEKTWPDAGVKQWISRRAVAVRIDTYAKRQDLVKRLDIHSYPTVILLDADGKELRRSLGFRDAAWMRSWLEGK